MTMKIKFTCNWCTDKNLYLRILSNYAIKSEYFDVITFNDDYDYLVIINDSKHPIQNKEKTIGLVMEPSWLSWNKDLHNMCKLVLFHDKSLYNWPNVVEWINCGFMHDNIDHTQLIDNNSTKTKNISAIFGILNDERDGYRMRKKLTSIIREKKLEVDLYGSNIQPLLIKYNGLIDYKFSICIENSFEKNFVTEKLYDCFMCNTVPIYCGAPNIFDIFSKKNMIKASSVEEILNIIVKIKNKEINYEDFDTQNAKLQYLHKLNLITQVLNVIKNI